MKILYHSVAISVATIFQSIIRIRADEAIKWIQITKARIPIPLSDLSVTPLGKKIILTGGCKSGNYKASDSWDFYCSEISDSAFSFDPAVETFSTLTKMPRSRYRHSSQVLNNQLYVFGGRDLDDNFIPEVDVYNPSTDSWTTPTVLPEKYQNSDFGSVTYKNLIYLVGGYSLNYTALKSLVAWDGLSTFTKKSDMSHERGDLSAAVLTSSKFKDQLYVAGGYTDKNNYCTPMADAERYDFATDKWYNISNLLRARGDMSISALNGRIYTVGGEEKKEEFCTNNETEDPSSFSVVVNLVESYTPTSSGIDKSTQWVDENDLAEFRFRSAATSWSDTNTLYVFGGQSDYNSTCKCFLSSDEMFGFFDSHPLASSAGNMQQYQLAIVNTVSIALALVMPFIFVFG